MRTSATGMPAKTFIASLILLSMAGCYGTDQARPAELEAARILASDAAFDPCHHDRRICRPGESPTGNSLDFCVPALCRDGYVLRLDFSNRGLAKLPSEVGQLIHLQYLDLSENQLTSLPPEISDLASLEGLSLDHNQLTSLPPEIGQLSNLEWISLDGNQLATLPPEVGQLTQLTSLTLRGNPLSGPLPAYLTTLPLNHFSFDNTDLCIPVDEDLQAWLASIEYVELLSPAASCGLASEEQAFLVALYEAADHPEGWSLDAAPCKWPGVGCSWTGHVTSLVLSHTPLRDLPAGIGQLVQLEWLDLSYNQLTRLPPEIGDLTNLRVLYVHNNQLTEPPPEIGSLTHVEDLLLFNNQLTQLPAELGRLTRLHRLDISKNPLSGPLPPFLTDIPPESLIFVFEDTDLCVPDDGVTTAWISGLNGLGETQVQWLSIHRACED